MSNPKLSDFDFGSIGKYELTLPNGVKIKTDGTQEDHSRAMEALESIGPLLQSVQPTQAFPQPDAPTVPRSEPLISAVDKWLANCAGKNADRTVTTKTYHIRNILDLMFRKVAFVDLWLAEHENTDYNEQRAIAPLKLGRSASPTLRQTLTSMPSRRSF